MRIESMKKVNELALATSADSIGKFLYIDCNKAFVPPYIMRELEKIHTKLLAALGDK